MKKLITEIDRMKSMMGLIVEDESVSLPVVVSGSYKVGKGDCDSFHAFNDNGSRVIGGMNNKVNEKLVELWNKKINPDITSVNVEMDSNTMEVKWSVTINKSTDGKAWVGIYSRGGGGMAEGKDSYPRYLSDKSGHTGIEECKKSNFIRKRGSVGDLVTIYTLKHYPEKGCKVKQFFYKYTLKEYKPH
jgi:hypothetical protein